MAQPQQIGSLISKMPQSSVETTNLPALSQTSSGAALALREQFADSVAFINAYAPKNQYRFCTDIQRCFMGKAPKLAVVKEAYGHEKAQAWIAFQLRDLSEFSGAREKLTPAHMDAISEVMISQFGHLKVTELMYFFLLFKSGKFGKFYGSVDGLAIMEALQEFCKMRQDQIAKYYEEEEKARKKAKEVEEQRQRELLMERYHRRVPDAFTDNAPINFLQYRLMGYDTMTDEQIRTECELISSGKKQIPEKARQMLEFVRTAFNIQD